MAIKRVSFDTKSFFSENASYKIVALLITLILWVIILGSKEATIVKMIPTDYLLPRDMVIVNTVPHEISFRITGPRLTLKRFSETVEPLAIDLTSAVEGLTTIRIHPDSIDVPPGLKVSSVSPATVTPKLERLISKNVSVEAALIGRLPPNRKLDRVIVNPPVWEIQGVRSAVESARAVKTEAIDLTGLQSSVTKDVAIQLDDPGLVKKRDSRVRVEVIIR